MLQDALAALPPRTDVHRCNAPYPAALPSHCAFTPPLPTPYLPPALPHPPHPQARLGRCAAPYLRVQDWAARTITQHCAAECGGCAAVGAAKLDAADFLAPVNEYCCAFEAGQYFSTKAPAGALPDL